MDTARTILTEAELDETEWGCRIINGEEAEYFNWVAQDKANNWRTCPVGVYHLMSSVVLPTGKLKTLGNAFEWAVRANKFVKAAQLLVEIKELTALN